jgi:hypothetical protein
MLGTAMKKRWVNHPPAIQKRVKHHNNEISDNIIRTEYTNIIFPKKKNSVGNLRHHKNEILGNIKKKFLTQLITNLRYHQTNNINIQSLRQNHNLEISRNTLKLICCGGSCVQNPPSGIVNI